MNELRIQKGDHRYPESYLRKGYAGRELRILLRMVDEDVEDEPDTQPINPLRVGN